MTKILMCGSTMNTKGGMVTVIQNYLEYNKWGEYEIKYVPTHFDGNKLIVAFHFLLRYIQIIFLVLTDNFKIAHLHTAERGSFWRKYLIAKTLKYFNIKIVMHHHGAEFEEFYDNASPKSKHRIRNMLEMVDVNIVLSKSLIPMIRNKAPNAHIKVLYNAVKTYEQNNYNINATNILFLGRLGQRKGVYDLLASIAEIDKVLPQEIKFYLCGDGEIGLVQKHIKDLGIAHRILHVGWINTKEKVQYFAHTMINILPSYNEGLPMTILETMAYGIPNISTAIASIPEVISHGQTGCLIQPGDISDICKNLLLLVNDSNLRKQISNNGYSLITEHFSLSANIEFIKEIYQTLL